MRCLWLAYLPAYAGVQARTLVNCQPSRARSKVCNFDGFALLILQCCSLSGCMSPFQHIDKLWSGMPQTLLSELLGLICICLVAQHNAQACDMQAACLTLWTPSASAHEVNSQAPAKSNSDRSFWTSSSSAEALSDSIYLRFKSI